MDINTGVQTIYGDHWEKFQETWNQQISELKSKFSNAIEEVRMPREFPVEIPTVYVKKESIVAVLEYAKTAPTFEYNFLSDLTAVDEETQPRFEVVYHLLSHTRFNRIRFKVRVNEGESVPTLVNIWAGANWQEREVWDMFGIPFEGHPDLRRILMDERWVGHPLRKDYPLRGYQIFPTPMEPNAKLLEN